MYVPEAQRQMSLQLMAPDPALLDKRMKKKMHAMTNEPIAHSIRSSFTG
jgi:hypothetical protein